MAIDFELLLAKYIEHVGAEEGSDFLMCLCRGPDGYYEGFSDKVKFTAEEFEALKVASARFAKVPA